MYTHIHAQSLVLGFVRVESLELPSLLPQSITALRLESCVGMGVGAGVLSPWAIHCAFVRCQLQVR